VVDAQSGRTLWPPDTSAGREIKLETPDIKELETQDKTDEKLYQRLTQKIATLFYASPAEMKDGTEMQ
jgi:hypothetical protein